MTGTAGRGNHRMLLPKRIPFHAPGHKPLRVRAQLCTNRAPDGGSAKDQLGVEDNDAPAAGDSLHALFADKATLFQIILWRCEAIAEHRITPVENRGEAHAAYYPDCGHLD